MIEITHVIDTLPEHTAFAIEGMRNPLNSWEYSDSLICHDGYCYEEKCPLYNENETCQFDDNFVLGPRDKVLMKKLATAGTAHRKFMRQMPVCMRITAPLYWWKEFDTYKVGTVSNSCSTMHKIMSKDFEFDDFSHDHLNETSLRHLKMVIEDLNDLRAQYLSIDKSDAANRKDRWWQIIQLLPSSYNQTRNVTLNYEVLDNIYYDRCTHKLDEWRKFCELIRNLKYGWLIMEE